MSRRAWVAVALGVLLAAGAAWHFVVPDTVEEAAELAGEGGKTILRKPLRPAGGPPRVLLIALDGVGEEALLAAVRGGRMPRVGSLLGSEGENGVFAHGYAVPGVLSVLPSTTLAAWSSLFTGEPPARTGVPGNEWFDREEARFYAPAPVSVSGVEDALATYTDGLVGGALRVPTLYERADVRSHVSLSQIHRGADLLTFPDLAGLADLAGSFAEGLAGPGAASAEAYETVDRAGTDRLIDALSEHGIPDLQVAYFPGVDLFTHVSADPIRTQQEYLRDVVDVEVGRILDAYARAGALEGTTVVFVSDHGHTPVLDTDRNALGTGEDDEPPALLERAGFRVRPFELTIGSDEEDFQATVAYQGAFAYVYLADRSSCPRPGDRCRWRLPPRLEEDVLPVVRAFDAANRTGAGIPQLRGTLDLILARRPAPHGQDAPPFEVWDGARLVSLDRYLAGTPRPDLLDLERRLEGLGAGPRGHLAGDVLILARTGPDRPIEERFYFSGVYRSWHGSPTAQDSRIPLVLARAGASGASIREAVVRAVGERPSQLDIEPLIRALLRK